MIGNKFLVRMALVLISLAINSPQIQAQNLQNQGDYYTKKPGRGVNRRAGSDRGSVNCLIGKSINRQLTALVADKSDALTVSDAPSFLFYVPYELTSPVQARFSLQDEEDYNVIKPILVSISDTPGVIKINLPKVLQKEKRYHWFFTIICQSTDESKNPSVDGWLRQVNPDPNLAQKLTEKISSRQLANAYRSGGFLLDALALLAEINHTDREAKTDWNNLLTSIGLPEITTEKIVQFPQNSEPINNSQLPSLSNFNSSK